VSSSKHDVTGGGVCGGGGSAIGIVGLALACVLLLAAGGCDKAAEELTKVDSEKEANRILVELEARGIKQAQKVEKAEQRKTAWSITVPAADLSAARTILVQCDLPRESHSGFSQMAESTSLIPTKSEERAKLIAALSGELERTFETYDRVTSARVHIVLPEKDPLAREATTRPSGSAMVLIKYTPLATEEAADGGSGGADRTAAVASIGSTGSAGAKKQPSYADAPVGMEEVQQMVARSVEGLTPQNVFVTFTKSAPRAPMAVASAVAAVTPGNGDNGTAAGTTASAGSGPADKKLMIQLFGAVAAFGLIAILLTVMLVREKKKQRGVTALQQA
jgi:type III secretion system YscJ/HrcJ family lipoprotein